MRFGEFLTEDISLVESRKHLIDTFSTEIPAVLTRLKHMADRHADNYTPKRGDDGRYEDFSARSYAKKLQFVLGSHAAKWYKETFWPRSRPSFFAYARYNQRHASELMAHLSDPERNSFSGIRMLMDAVGVIAEKTNDRVMASAVAAGRRAFDSYSDHLVVVRRKAAENNGVYSGRPDDIESRSMVVGKRDPSKMPVINVDTGVDGYLSDPSNEVYSQQRMAVDSIVHATLKRLPTSVSGEIRNAIARSSNKLMALQQELNKRGIKL
jgi:hypothetical protein